VNQAATAVVAGASDSSEFKSDSRLPWIIAIVGFAAMYAPVYWAAANGIWKSEEQGHGPIIVAVLIWLFWGLRKQIGEAASRPTPALGIVLFALGLLTYAFGRIFNVSILEFASQPFIVASVLLLFKGTAALRLAWFPVLYFIFMIPLPGVFIDAVTGSLKGWISNIVEAILYFAGYPIARSGVILSIGPYQLQVADACSGLNSMFSLSALGTLFMYIMGRKSRTHVAVMLLSILPIAFAANIIRVITLVLITFYLGDEAGQGFLHGAAGMLLMLVALMLFFLLDKLLDLFLKPRSRLVTTSTVIAPPDEQGSDTPSA
jgi:exosortase B